MLMSTWRMVNTPGCHSSPLPLLSHVPRSERQTVHCWRKKVVLRAPWYINFPS
ncbi:hypothetical protein EJ02DRAFT_202066 [Clathrospora elynae]|uniref:Uncharacterized protein n=1 Tax=Clathrospora elynae TaxID=706981 RepID=A0A6A5SLP4_9PLEO|nr:hypothetical protein EJ02DRAFT_202066 [Clathrospora elynae]